MTTVCAGSANDISYPPEACLPLPPSSTILGFFSCVIYRSGGEAMILYQTVYTLYTTECTGCAGKIVFVHNSLQPLPRLHRCKRPSKLSTQYRGYSHSHWLIIFCTTNSSRLLARERWQTFENS